MLEHVKRRARARKNVSRRKGGEILENTTGDRTQSHASMVAYSYHSKFVKDFMKKTFKMNRFFNENVKQKINYTLIKTFILRK